MNFKKNTFLSSVILIHLLFIGCVSEQGLMQTWRSTEEYDNSFKKVIVIGLANNLTVRTDIEGAVVNSAREIQLSAERGINMFPPELGKPFDDIEEW